jgi:hypothetical protein
LLRSKVAILALPPASRADCTAVSANGAPSVTTWSMEESCRSLAVIVAFTDGMSVPLT